MAVIGAGSAGLQAYRGAKAAGASAILIKDGPHDTTCARAGCMPSKLLIAVHSYLDNDSPLSIAAGRKWALRMLEKTIRESNSGRGQ